MPGSFEDAVFIKEQQGEPEDEGKCHRRGSATENKRGQPEAPAEPAQGEPHCFLYVGGFFHPGGAYQSILRIALGSGRSATSNTAATPPGQEHIAYSGGIKTSHLRRRAALACAAVAILVLGLLARTGLPGILGDASGGILYAALLYLLLAFVLPGARRWLVAGAAVVVCVLVELFQLTGYPTAWGTAWPPLRLVFGTTFNAWDLPAYAVGAAAACLADRLLRRSDRPVANMA